MLTLSRSASPHMRVVVSRSIPVQLDWLLMLVGTVCAAGAGVVMPLFSIVFGDILDAFHGPDPTEQVGGGLAHAVEPLTPYINSFQALNVLWLDSHGERATWGNRVRAK